MLLHCCVSLILLISRTHTYWLCSLHGEGCHKQRRHEKFFRQGLKNNLHKFDQLIILRNMMNMQEQIFQKNWGTIIAYTKLKGSDVM